MVKSSSKGITVSNLTGTGGLALYKPVLSWPLDSIGSARLPSAPLETEHDQITIRGRRQAAQTPRKYMNLLPVLTVNVCWFLQHIDGCTGWQIPFQRILNRRNQTELICTDLVYKRSQIYFGDLRKQEECLIYVAKMAVFFSFLFFLCELIAPHI